MSRAAAALVLAVLFLGDAAGRDAKEQEKFRLVRVYVIDRQKPDRTFEDAAASLTLRYRSGKSETVLLPRVARETATTTGKDAEVPAVAGKIRGLTGVSYYVELVWDGRSVAPARRDPDHREPDHQQPPSPQEILRRVHEGPSFAASLPEARLSEVASAVVTLRLGSMSWSSEEYRKPGEAEETGVDGVERAVQRVRDRAVAGATFMDVRPAALDLIGEVSALASAGFRDPTGAFEQDRQTCMALARAIEKACADADWGRIQNLCLQYPPRLKNMLSMEKTPPTEAPAAH